jgi:hypothetical protein
MEDEKQMTDGHITILSLIKQGLRLRGPTHIHIDSAFNNDIKFKCDNCNAENIYTANEAFYNAKAWFRKIMDEHKDCK